MNREPSTCNPTPFPRGAAPAPDATVLRGAGNAVPGTARLVVTAGPGKGAGLALGTQAATLGRGADNALVIRDISVSRRHARIEERAGAWVVIDEGSGNGTRVNGAPVVEQRLRDGDELAVGDVRLRFIEPGGVAARALPQPKPGPARPFRTRFLLCAAAVALVFGAGQGVHRFRNARIAAGDAAAREQARMVALRRFHQGVKLLQAGQREQAREDLDVAAELDPANQEIRRTRAALDVDAAAGGEVHHAPQPKPADPSPQPRQPDPPRPSEPVSPKPGEPPPGAPAGKASLKSAPLHMDPAATAPRHRSGKGRSSLTSGSDAEAEAIVAAYRSGELGAARARAQEGRTPEAARLSAALKDFERACREAAEQKTPEDALRSLEVAAAADRAIAGSGGSRPGGEVRKALSAQHLLAAATLKSDDQLPRAAAHLRAAVEANPSSPSARDALRRLHDRVHDLYLRGYVAKETEPAEARRCLGLVIQALPAADETAQKAKRWLDKLEGKAAE